jgi:hypothetical protein
MDAPAWLAALPDCPSQDFRVKYGVLRISVSLSPSCYRFFFFFFFHLFPLPPYTPFFWVSFLICKLYCKILFTDYVLFDLKHLGFLIQISVYA